jgi:hypothetical protein
MLRQICLFAFTALVTGLLAGCISEYQLYAEDPAGAAPDFSEPCRYSWVAENSRYRTVDSNGYGWSDAGNYGQSGLLPYLKQISSQCAASAPRGASEARVSAYSLEYVNRENRKSMMTPAGIAQMLTLGYAPIGMSNYFAVCVEARLPDGRRRAAMARGTLESTTNVWGAMDGPGLSGDTLRRKNREELLRHLTLQSWNKLWAPGETLDEHAVCRDTLDTLAKFEQPTPTRTTP